MRSLRKEFQVAVGSGDCALRINSDAIIDALRTIHEVCNKHSWEMRVWDQAAGVVWYNGEKAAGDPPRPTPPRQDYQQMAAAAIPQQAKAPSPTEVLRSFLDERPVPLPAKEDDEASVKVVILVMVNFHLCFGDRVVDRNTTCSLIQHVVNDKVEDHPDWTKTGTTPGTGLRDQFTRHGLEGALPTGKYLVALMPDEAKLPEEIRPLFNKVITHELPDREELKTILQAVVPEDLLTDELIEHVCRHALGLTRLQAEGIFAAAALQHGSSKNFDKLFPRYVWEQKSEILNAEKLVTLYDGKETYADVVGQQGLKTLLKDLLTPDRLEPDNPDVRSKGVALVGPPRTGKSLVAKATGNELSWPTLIAHPGNLMGGYVGDTERNTRKFFQLIRAHAPCIVVIDEVEKVMPSARGDGGDSGVGKRMAGTFMSQMQDIQEWVFWVFTANGVEDLHEAFLADDRVDQVVYVHMPDKAQRVGGWRMFLKKYFPEEIGGKKSGIFLDRDFDSVLGDFEEAKKKEPATWVPRFVAAMLCTAQDKRSKALGELRAANAAIHDAVVKDLFSDEGWTIARIKSCCRLARLRNKTLSAIARTMPRGSTKLEKAIGRLEKWAEEEAIDAETGLAYVREHDEEGETRSPRKESSGDKVRRKVKTMRDD